MHVAKLPLTLRTFLQRISHQKAHTEHLVSMLSVRMTQQLDVQRTSLSERAVLLQSLSPLAILKRGYSITTDAKGNTVRRSDSLSKGDRISTRFGEGQASSDITEVS